MKLRAAVLRNERDARPKARRSFLASVIGSVAVRKGDVCARRRCANPRQWLVRPETSLHGPARSSLHPILEWAVVAAVYQDQFAQEAVTVV